MARNDVFLNINALSPADAVVTGQQDMSAATVPELVLGDTPTFNFYFTDNTNVWPSWAGNASYTLTWALSDAVAGDFAPAATTGNATPITGGWSVILPLNSYDLVGLLNTKRVGQPYPVQNLWQQLRVTDPSGNEITRAMFWTPVRYRAISDTQNTESASPTGGRFVTVNNVNTLTTPTAAQFYAANPVPTSALGTAANGELLIGNGTGFTKATLTAGSGVSISNGSGSITITATDGDITLDDGTAAAPSLKFTADTDTGLFRPSDNVVGISAGGVSRATFGATSAINGTTIPGSKTLVVTTDKLSALAATTSAELAGVISDETGSGALVFATSPTLTTPNIGAATGTSFNLTGSGTLGTTLTVNSTTDSSSKDTGAIVTEGGLGVEKSATFGGNLTVSGTAMVGPSAANPFSGPIGIAFTGNPIWAQKTTAIGNSETYGFGIGDSASNGRSTFFGHGKDSGGNYFGFVETYGSTVPIKLNASSVIASGNLTVSGGTITGGTSGMSLAAGGTNQNITLTPSGTGGLRANLTTSATAFEITNNNNITFRLNRTGVANPGAGGLSLTSSGALTAFADADLSLSVNGSTSATAVFLAYGPGTTPVANTLVLRDGCTLLGTTTNSANGKLQLATHTTSAGGIGFGTDTSLFRSAAGALQLESSATAVFEIDGGAGNTRGVVIQAAGTEQAAITVAASGTSLLLSTGSPRTTALTLDSSQNATFAKNLTVGSGTASQNILLNGTVDNYIRWANAGNARWQLITTTSETGSNAGSDLSISRFSDAGSFLGTAFTLTRSTGNATFAGAIAIGNTVNTVSPTSPNRTITMVIGGTTYYIHAKTTND